MYTYTYTGNLTSQNAYELKNELLNLVNQGHKILCINLLEVADADVVGVNALAITHKEIMALGGKMDLLINKNSQLATLLHLTKFNKIFTIITH
jgi:anti-anti-sigma regulatory factor